MIPGTRPARRSARAAPLLPRERDAALIRVTVAMMYPRLFSLKRCVDLNVCLDDRGSLQGCGGPRWRAYSGAHPKTQGTGYAPTQTSLRVASLSTKTLQRQILPRQICRRSGQLHILTD